MVGKFAAVLWLEERNYSVVAVKKLVLKEEEKENAASIVGKTCVAEYEHKKSSICEVIAVGEFFIFT